MKKNDLDKDWLGDRRSVREMVENACEGIEYDVPKRAATRHTLCQYASDLKISIRISDAGESWRFRVLV